MPKNRDYTGLERTPSSMAWLIRQRSILRGKLEKLKALQVSLPESIRSLEADLASIDAVIPLHEVKVDPTVIRGRRPHRPAIADYGLMSPLRSEAIDFIRSVLDSRLSFMVLNPRH